ncbi:MULTISPECIES: IclR family transcriptional regulator [Microtetraspora]|uniref:IclR family transcriptional regulator n=1 Tax=Microtetraspora glauca TaxID=1996 RepID=A0ABV3G9C8_MICGL|nr:IclR family transcriptional regulator [Microtetraspora sp. AC03309]MCC5575330.1 IclR family transcriptional regulator [Microtetraspora sp. AC03309]
MRANESGRSVTSRVLSILEAFETHGPSLSLSQLAELTGLPVSTAHRLLGELHAWGALARDDQGRYHVGLRLWELSQSAGRRLRDTARPYLQDLFSLTQETSHIAIREGNEALYVDRVYSSKRVPRASRIGGRLPLHATAVGKVLLAYEEPWFREAYLHGDLEARTVRTHVDPAGLADELAQIAEQGYAITLEEARAGACSIAVPVAGRSDQVEASVGLVLLSTQGKTLTRHLSVLRGVASRIEAAIARYPSGYPRQRG